MKTKKRYNETDDFAIVASPDELPAFQREAEEHALWKTHAWSEAMMDQAKPDPDLPLPRPKVRSSPPRSP